MKPKSTMEKQAAEIRRLRGVVAMMLLLVVAFCAKYWGWL